jgi:CheY-like chemotaxis protein
VERETGKAMKICVIDDEPLVGRVCRGQLNHLGHESVVFQDPERALEAILTPDSGFDIVLTDQNMPQRTGLEVIRALRNAGWKLPIILATGFNDSILPDEIAAYGITALLDKPYRIEDLERALATALSS